MTVIQLLTQLVTECGQVLALLNNVLAILSGLARDSSPFHISNRVDENFSILSDGSIGNAAIVAQLAALSVQLADVQSNLETAIGSPQQSTLPVQLPTIPPPGYGGGSASDVWNFVLGDGNVAADELVATARAAVNMSTVFYIRVPGQPYLAFWANYVGENYPIGIQPQAPLDPLTILPTDATATDWVLREYAAYSWFNFAGAPPFYADGFDPQNNWVLDVSADEFAVLKAFAAGQWPPGAGAAANLAPVWPGLALVTLGTQVALSDGLVVTGPMDGVIVTVTSVPYPMSYYAFGTHKSYVKVGGIAFVDDNGDLEQVQPIGIDSYVVCPKYMRQATSAILRVRSGVVGTIQPWTVT